MDPRKQRTYECLTQAFLELIDECGYSAITVSTLCDRAHIRRATFYKHFSDKDAFLLFLVRNMREQLKQDLRLDERGSVPFDEFCRLLTRSLARIVYARQSTLRKLKVDPAYDALMASTARELATDLAEEIKSAGEDVETTVVPVFYVSGLFGVLRWYLDQPGDFNQERFMCDMDRMIRSVW